MTHAEAAANYARRLLADRQRDVYQCGQHVILFGNDGYAHDARFRREVELIRAALPAYGITEYEFGLSDDGMAWAIVAAHVCEPEDLEDLHNELWACWAAACKDSAAGLLRRHGNDLPGQLWLWDEDGNINQPGNDHSADIAGDRHAVASDVRLANQ